MIPIGNGYSATVDGFIWSSKTEKRLIGGKDKDGYLNVSLRVDGKLKTYRRARLICEAYHGMGPDGYQVNHINGIKSDDRPLNLEWVSGSDNSKHAVDVLGNWPNLKLNQEDVDAIRSSQDTNKSLSERYGVHNSTISLIRSNKRRACKI